MYKKNFKAALVISIFCSLVLVSNCQIINAIAGNGSPTFSGDNGSSLLAGVSPHGLAFDLKGNIYVADEVNNRIRIIDKNGVISTFAGDGIQGFKGDSGFAINASLNSPTSVVYDNYGGFLYIVDHGNNRVRKVNGLGIISTVAGNGVYGYSGDGGSALLASFTDLRACTLDNNGNLYIVSADAGAVRKVDNNGIVTTVAGNGGFSYSGDGGQAINASFTDPQGVAVDTNGNIYIGDYCRIRKVDIGSGIINTISGDGISGYSGDGGLAINARIKGHGLVSIDINNNLYIADAGNNRIRRINPFGLIETVAGDGTSGYVDGCLAISSQLNNPVFAALNPYNGKITIADAGNNRVRQINNNATPVSIVNLKTFVFENQVKTTWQTATEINTDYFNVQRSIDGKEFSNIGTVKAAGNSTISSNYLYTDLDAAKTNASILYYRLQSIDKDGSSSYSRVVSVQLNNNNFPLITISPNPVKDHATIHFNHPIEKGTISVYDEAGNKVYDKAINTPLEYYTFNVQNLKTGIYIVVLKTGNKVYQQKIFIN